MAEHADRGGVVLVGGFAKALRERVRAARARVAAAVREGDAYERAVAEDELDDALRIARAHGVSVEEDTDGPSV
ncbi:hypothetical protein [Streptomyces acidiscabies]|uniref:Uncharacterized protein n=1 Tax=Streptomyces acidiscabies TaxID=42234 RepID=A0AAP6BKF6_9ACTN|nr:hypothetical protein [Streptomyces acidiscabies]MDX2966373.1 hypothetical protein [Streptomyces acidiscabies]MDX3025475.1 hypothetical protein [Streptomyces acidiscabies]MDX3795937.1 hypothetical protein [Streptomyces acidiscabies]